MCYSERESHTRVEADRINNDQARYKRVMFTSPRDVINILRGRTGRRVLPLPFSFFSYTQKKREGEREIKKGHSGRALDAWHNPRIFDVIDSSKLRCGRYERGVLEKTSGGRAARTFGSNEFLGLRRSMRDTGEGDA